MRSSARPPRRKSPPSSRRPGPPSTPAKPERADSARPYGARRIGRGGISAEPDARQVDARAETAALVALLRTVDRRLDLGASIRAGTPPTELLAEKQGLLAEGLLQAASNELARWEDEGLHVLTPFDPGYPPNLRAAHDRPPLIFVAGEYRPSDTRSVAVIGSRSASPAGLERARAVVEHLVARSYAVVSGLAAGIDSAAHTTALDCGGRTIAVIGTGIQRCYPPANAELQRRIAAEGAVISQFLPDEGPTRGHFPKRNAVMSGIALATVVVEAGMTSGARTQVRFARAQGRPVFLAEALLEQRWARELAEQSGVHAFDSPEEIVAAVDRVLPPQGLLA